jgi:hypothetical protein
MLAIARAKAPVAGDPRGAAKQLFHQLDENAASLNVHYRRPVCSSYMYSRKV